MPLLPPLRYIGSFQDRGALLRSDSPLDEVWSTVGRFGRAEYLQRLTTDNPLLTKPWSEWGPYATVRIRQACELRLTSGSAGLVTRPLLLYYAFLGILRGFLALEKQQIASPAHGLRYESGNTLLDSNAKLQKGTFRDYLLARDCAVDIGTVYSLQDCIRAIAEMAGPWASMGRGWPNVFAVGVDARDDGSVLLKFHYPHAVEEFRESWSSWFPKLSASCDLEPTGSVLRVRAAVDTSSREQVRDFLWSNLWVPLDWSDTPIWFAHRRSVASPELPRDAYYFIALFILSSIVRYQPEHLAELQNSESDLSWLLERLLRCAERYFPQLMLHWVVTQPAFF